MKDYLDTPLIALVGQTAVGKTDASITIAKAIDAEIISVDSRQVYKHLDVGTAKIAPHEMDGIPHHGIDIVAPDYQYTVAEFEAYAMNTIKDINARNRVPLLVGGSAQYLYAVIDGDTGAAVVPNHDLRIRLEQQDTDTLLNMLTELDEHRATTIDQQNKRRIIRAIEIATALGHVPPVSKQHRFDTCIIGLRRDRDELRSRIRQRIVKRKDALILEVKGLLETNIVTTKRLMDLGLEYRYTVMLLEDTISDDEFIEQLTAKTWQFARRQMNWFKRDDRIQWFHPDRIDDIVSVVQDLVS